MNKDTIKQAFQLGYVAGCNRHNMEKSAGLFSNLLWMLGGAGLLGGGYYAYKNSPEFKALVDKAGLKLKGYGQTASNFIKTKWNALRDGYTAARNNNNKEAPAPATQASSGDDVDKRLREEWGFPESAFTAESSQQ